MKAKNTVLRLVGAAMVTVALAPWMGGGTASAAAPATYNATLKTSHQGVTAAGFPSKQTDCPGWSPTEGTDSFHFVLDGNYVFTSLTVEFSTGTITTTTFGPPTASTPTSRRRPVRPWSTRGPPCHRPREGAGLPALARLCREAGDLVAPPVTTRPPVDHAPAGDPLVAAGDLVVSAGDLVVSAGDLVALRRWDLVVSAGDHASRR